MPTSIVIRDVGSLSQKFVTRGQAAVDDWKKGVQQTTKSQSGNAIAAAANWQAALQGEKVLARFKARLTAAGDGKWRTNAVTKGADQGRFSGGIGAAGPAWAAGVAPIFQALTALQLPDRGLKRSPANLQRVAAVIAAEAAASGKA
jgi:hypothetical protein